MELELDIMFLKLCFVGVSDYLVGDFLGDFLSDFFRGEIFRATMT
jgi:hypothetical protein